MKSTRLIGALACAAALCSAAPASAAETEIVTEADVTRQLEGTPPAGDWVIYTRPATPGVATFQNGPQDPPLGSGSLNLTTVGGSDKVWAFNYEHVGTKLSDVDTISYATYRQAGNLQQVTALNLEIDFNGPSVTGGFSTLVFEPVYNTAQGAVVSGEWQDWDADGSGRWWSTQAINGQGPGATGANMRTWDQIVENNPDAVVIGGMGLNQGSGNPTLVASSDALTFDETTYDFEPTPASKDDCKNGGWESYGDRFKNQGDCVSSFAPGRDD